MEIVPAIDIIDGKCVRLTQGDYQQKKVYNEDPLEVAKSFEDVGIRRLHLVDLDGAKASRIINQSVLERIASNTNLHIDFGGGLKSDEDVRIAFEAGAQQITGGTIAVKKPEVFLSWLEKYGAEKIILGADTKNGRIAVSGWQEESELELLSFLKDYHQKGIRYVICTDISKDGMLQGSAQELYRLILKELPDLQLIASGGVSSIADVVALRQIGCQGAIIGKAIYEGKISLAELSEF
ncbi:MAG: 1-(5-phosphoribosyl)-5-[(5-phosphoribosylamino)methylideneamino]imidazole-4-carboxamide isomerase [Saprospiraceae bacterium]|nr:1-(5-phosphoribosyl)-5-[(5-phosphoribosylamino)methylideneamino]imidazole-4-carboxamide isomerase [Saprospiraceae bacterium]